MRIPLQAALLVLSVVCGQEQEHFLDVRQIVKGTIEAMQRLPEAAIQQQKEANDSSTAKPEDLMSLFKLPADIMTKLAVNAGYMDEPQTSTYRPWIVARNKEDSEYETDSGEEAKKKSHRRKRPEDDGLVNIKDLLRPLPTIQPQLQAAAPTLLSQIQGDTNQAKTQQDPLYKKEILPDGQVRFVPVYLSPVSPTPAPVMAPITVPSASSSPFMVATPLTAVVPRRIMQSDPRFEAQTFPPAVNPFQTQTLPPRIIQTVQPLSQPLPQPVIPILPPQPAFPIPPPAPTPIPVPNPSLAPTPIPVPNPQPVQQVQQPTVEVQSSEQGHRKPLLVHPVPKEATSRSPKVVEPIRKSKKPVRVLSEETIASTEDEAIIHSEESEPAPVTRKSVISKTALRVRTIEHDAVRKHHIDEEKEHKNFGKSKKKSHPAKKRTKVKVPPMDDEPVTAVPTAKKPSQLFEEVMEAELDRPRVSNRRRIHASKTFKIGRKESRLERKERISGELEELSSHNSEPEEDEEEIEVTTRPPPRKSRLWKRKTVRPKSKLTTTPAPTTSTTTTTTTTTTTPRPTTTTTIRTTTPEEEEVEEEEEEVETTTKKQVRKERKKKKKTADEKTPGKRTKKRRKIQHNPPTRPTPAPLVVPPQTCANIRSFARQFGMFDMRQFAYRHCQFVENYYPELTCDRVDEYVYQCQILHL